MRAITSFFHRSIEHSIVLIFLRWFTMKMSLIVVKINNESSRIKVTTINHLRTWPKRLPNRLPLLRKTSKTMVRPRNDRSMLASTWIQLKAPYLNQPNLVKKIYSRNSKISKKPLERTNNNLSHQGKTISSRRRACLDYRGQEAVRLTARPRFIKCCRRWGINPTRQKHLALVIWMHHSLFLIKLWLQPLFTSNNRNKEVVGFKKAIVVWRCREAV